MIKIIHRVNNLDELKKIDKSYGVEVDIHALYPVLHIHLCHGRKARRRFGRAAGIPPGADGQRTDPASGKRVPRRAALHPLRRVPVDLPSLWRSGRSCLWGRLWWAHRRGANTSAERHRKRLDSAGSLFVLRCLRGGLPDANSAARPDAEMARYRPSRPAEQIAPAAGSRTLGMDGEEAAPIRGELALPIAHVEISAIDQFHQLWREPSTQLLDGLSHLHALGILHCKLRPQLFEVALLLLVTAAQAMHRKRHCASGTAGGVQMGHARQQHQTKHRRGSHHPRGHAGQRSGQRAGCSLKSRVRAWEDQPRAGRGRSRRTQINRCAGITLVGHPVWGESKQEFEAYRNGGRRRWD